MRRFISFAAAALLLAACVNTADPYSAVDPTIGTDDHGHVFLGANVPFGMVQLGPTQITHGWDWCSGYARRDTIIIGFSHTHLSGTGIGDLGDVMFMPYDPARVKYTDASFDENAGNTPRHVYASLDHSLETVQPGYYAVELPDYGIKVRLTAGTWTGYHEYTFSGDESAILVDLCTGIGWDSVYDWTMEVVDDHTIRGRRLSAGWASDQKCYYYAMFSEPFTLGEDLLLSDTPSRALGRPASAKVLKFDTSRNKKVYAVVGLSNTGEQAALDNIGADTRKGNNFEKNVEFARRSWREALGHIEIEGLDARQEKIFYTALYHTMMFPSHLNDASAPAEYTNLSLWDTYRSENPLYSVIMPERAGELAAGMIAIARRQGKMPVWHLWDNETDCMIGNPGVIVTGDYIVKGLYKGDLREALDLMDKSFMADDRGNPEFMTYGYVPYDCSEKVETVSMTLELSVAASAVRKVADMVGDAALSARYDSLSRGYAKHFDAASGFLRARSRDGSFKTPFNPFSAQHMEDDYTEGNAWQYTFMVPHDVSGLIETFGGRDAFVGKLDSLFVAEGDMGTAHSDVTGLIGQYAHGNEPCHHVAYMYAVAGRPDKTQKVVRTIMDSLYFDRPAGLCGNEDMGQMSAWYVLSALGLYQVDPCGGDFWLGSPAVKKAVINGNFTITARNNSRKNIYVKSARLNGRLLDEPRISYSDIMAGGKLEFEMTDKPNEY